MTTRPWNSDADTPPSVALCLIATGNYDRFVPDVVESARQFFLAGCNVSILLFADAEPPDGLVDEWFRIDHEPWPGPTLHRYHHLLTARETLLQHDYVFYVDVDCRFIGPMGREILSDLTAVIGQSVGSMLADTWNYERRACSTAKMFRGDGRFYYIGGFQGGRSSRYITAMEAMQRNIDQDAARGVTARWHDESHWNRYLAHYPPGVSLPPMYCCAENNLMKEAVLLALVKQGPRA